MNIKITKKDIISIILKFGVFIFSLLGVIFTLKTGRHNLLYFTIQSNIFIGLICLIGIVLIIYNVITGKKVIAKWMHIVKFVATIAITITGFIYCAVLMPVAIGYNPWEFYHVFCHMTVPALAIADFFVFDSYIEYKYRYMFLSVIPFMYYLLLSVTGYHLGWDYGNNLTYPYFFLNWGSPLGAFGIDFSTFPYMGCVHWGNGLTLFVIGLSAFYIKLIHIVQKRRETKKLK